MVIWDIDPDIICDNTLREMVKDSGFRDVERFYYLKSEGIMPKDLVLCWDNINFNQLIKH